MYNFKLALTMYLTAYLCTSILHVTIFKFTLSRVCFQNINMHVHVKLVITGGNEILKYIFLKSKRNNIEHCECEGYMYEVLHT